MAPLRFLDVSERGPNRNHTVPMDPRLVRRRRVHATGQAVIAAFECYALAEVVWFVVTDGESHLYEVIQEQADRLAHALRYRAQIADTLRMIRRLPEGDKE